MWPLHEPGVVGSSGGRVGLFVLDLDLEAGAEEGAEVGAGRCWAGHGDFFVGCEDGEN